MVQSKASETAAVTVRLEYAGLTEVEARRMASATLAVVLDRMQAMGPLSFWEIVR